MKVDHIQVTLTPHNIQVIHNILLKHEKEHGDQLGLAELIGAFGTLHKAAYEKTIY